MRAIRVMVLAVSVVGFVASDASAQLKLPRTVVPVSQPRVSRNPPPRSGTTNHELARLQQLPAGERIDVELFDGTVIAGRFVAVDLVGLTVRVDDRMETIKRDDIAYVMGMRSNKGLRAASGVMGGALTGLVMSVLHGNGEKHTTAWILGGAVAGGSLGAVAGSLEQYHVVFYSSPR